MEEEKNEGRNCEENGNGKRRGITRMRRKGNERKMRKVEVER